MTDKLTDALRTA